MRDRFVKPVFGALALLMLLPLVASAQSTLTGAARDESGAALPGVTVEASSPALIEKARTVVTDGQGRFRIIDLRPGIYRLSFALEGFSTTVREGIEVPSNLVVTVNADMKVGALQESVTVSGEAPQVDVQQAARTQVLSRELLDALPVSRNSMQVGYLSPGVRMSAPDIGGSNLGSQPGMRAHGVRAPNGVLQLVDGLSVATYEGNQLVYFDESSQSEVSVSTGGLASDSPVGGIRVNSILRDGGNTVSGDVHLNGTDGDWLSSPITEEVRSKYRLASASGLSHVQYFTGTVGGPILQNKVWYILGARHAASDVLLPGVPKEIVTPTGQILSGVSDAYIRDASVRLTWQATPKQKFQVFVQRIWKRLGSLNTGTDPRIATQRDPHHAHNYLGMLKWTATPTNKWLLEVGHVQSVWNWRSTPAQLDLQKPRGTPEWFAGAQRIDTARNINPNCAYTVEQFGDQAGCLQWGSLTDNRTEAGRLHTMAAATYVTGTHNIRIGFNNNSGLNSNKSDRNADLVQNYTSNRPSTVTVYNTPTSVPGHVNYDLGFFAQDSWTMNRLTLNPGVRIEWYKASVRAVKVPAGRFAPERNYPEVSTPTWGPDYLPRLSAVYDLFGTGKTALKVSASRYNENSTAQATIWPYADAGSRSESRNWFDCDMNAAGTGCSGRVVASNGDDIAQDNEIGPSPSGGAFGNRADRNYAPDIERVKNWEYSAGVQHQLIPSLSVGAMYYRRTYDGIWRLDRTQISTSDYTAFQIRMPTITEPEVAAVLDPNESITVYNLNPAKRSVFNTALIDSNSPDLSIYNGVEVSFNARFRQFTGFGSWNIERNVSVFCSSDDDPNGTNTESPASATAGGGLADQYQGQQVSNGGRFCDGRQAGIPFVNEFKVAGNYVLPYQVGIGVVWQGMPGTERVITYNVPASLFPGGRTNAETIILNKPGSLYYPRYNQVDINFKKTFRFGTKQLTAQVDLFNALNEFAIFSQTNAVGASLGQVLTTLQGRTPRVGVTLKF
jgi:carboxypeptidase family protein